MKTVEVHVTAEHIANGSKRNCGSCPVALAIREAVPGTYITVDLLEVSFGPHLSDWVDLPDEVTGFITRFDNGKPVEPFTFTLRIPAVASVTA